jgi:PilZ domain
MPNEDKRKAARQRSFLRGFIRTLQSPSNVDCIIRDISETGAKLRFRSTPVIADSFELHIPAKGQILQSRLVWMDNCEAGVSFVAVAASAIPPSNDEAQSVRISQLENEVVALKRMLVSFQHRLDEVGGWSRQVRSPVVRTSTSVEPTKGRARA